MLVHGKARRAVAAGLMVALAAVTLVASPSGAQEPPTSEAPPPHALERAERGEAAIRALGERLPEVAGAHGISAERLRRLLRSDETLWVDPSLRLFYVEPEASDHGSEDEHAEAPSGEDFLAESIAPHPLEDTFLLESRQGSLRTIYLDFTGDTVTGTGWNNVSQFGTGDTIVADPYDIDGDPSTFSAEELEDIQDVWRRVAEDFAPWGVNVTTKDLGLGAVDRADGSDENYGTRVLIDGGTAALACGCGGIAYVGVFDRYSPGPWDPKEHAYYQPAWVFQAGVGTPKNIAEAATHEAGHNLGLSHDGLDFGEDPANPGQPHPDNRDYYTGHENWAPIMGVGYDKPLVQWSKGDYPAASNDQADFTVMQSNGITPIADDHGDLLDSTATNLGTSSIVLEGSGLISTPGDTDVFSFTTDGGLTLLQATPAAVSPNLDISVELYDSLGALLDHDDPPSGTSTIDVATGLEAEVAALLAAGTYYLRVEGVGVPTTAEAVGYSDYGSLGHYDVAVLPGLCALGDPDDHGSDAASAGLLVGGQSTSGTRCQGADEWFLVPGISGATFTVDATAMDPGGDVDIELLDESLAQVALAQTPGDTERLVHEFLANEDHYLRVHSTGDTETRYELTTSLPACAVDDQYEPDNDTSTATPLTPPAIKDGVSCAGDANNADFALVPLIEGREATVRVDYASGQGAIDLRLLEPVEGGGYTTFSGIEKTTTADSITIRYTPPTTETYLIWVYWSSGEVPYRLVARQPVPDSPPTVVITQPVDGSVVSGEVAITAEASDGGGVTEIEFLVDGVSVGVDTDEGDGWGVPWDSSGVSASEFHSIRAVARDSAAQETESAAVSVVVVDLSGCPCASSPDLVFRSAVPGRAIDGDPATFWQPTAGPGPAGTDPKTFQLSLPVATVLTGLEFEWYSVDHRFVDYTIETSLDGVAWTTVATVVGNTSVSYVDEFAPVEATHVRVTSTLWKGSSTWGPALRELAWRDLSGCPCASSPDLVFRSAVPGRAIDGDPATFWQPTAGPGPAGTDPKTFQLSLPVATVLTGLEFEWYSVDHRFVDYTIETSLDGVAWTTVATVVGNTSVSYVDEFAPVEATHVRVTSTLWKGSSTWGPALRELAWTRL